MKEFIKKDTKVLVDTPYAEAYIPKDLFGNPEDGNPTAYYLGEGICVTGLFNIRFYNSDKDPRESAKLRTFNYPSTITMFPSATEDLKLQLDKSMDEDTYRVCRFYKGDIIMDTKIQQDSKKCEAFMNLLIRGKLPKGLDYTALYFAWMKNFEINRVDPGVPAVTLQFAISENCRSAQNPKLQFRKIVNEKGVNMSDYKVHNMVNICSNSSVLNALAFERYGEMLTYSLNMSNQDMKQNLTPLEEVLRM